VNRLAVAFAALLLAVPAFAQQREVRSSGPGTYRVHGVPRGYSLNIREQPETGSKLIGRIPSGTRKIRGFGCTDDTPKRDLWCRVKHRDVVGWVSEEFIRQD
jgi:hypothetical protein